MKGRIPIISKTLTDLFTIIYVLIDDWYQKYGIIYVKEKTGPKSELTDSEVLTLMFAKYFIPFLIETQYIEFIRAYYHSLFPKLINQSQYNRRARGLYLLVEELRKYWILKNGCYQYSCYLLDTKQIPVLSYKRNKKHNDFWGSANYGVCAILHLRYFVFKLVAIAILDRIPMVFELVHVNLDEKTTAKAIIDNFSYCNLLTDKGFIGVEWQSKVYNQTNI